MHFLHLLIIGILFFPSSLNASPKESSLWHVKSEKELSYEKHMDDAAAFIIAATSTNAKSLAKRAIKSFEAAAKLLPQKREPHFLAAETISIFIIAANVAPPRYLRKAIFHWRQFEKKAPLDPRLRSILTDRAIAFTKLRGKANLEAAIQDYNYALQLTGSNEEEYESLSRLLSNQAEVYMMLGKLEEAISGYQQALEYYQDTVYGYGLAVALDRNHQKQRAREVARYYAKGDTGGALHRNGTFFVPPGEKFYYMGLSYEGINQYRKALDAYNEFIRRVPSSIFIESAKENIRDITPKALQEAKKAKKAKKANIIPGISGGIRW